MKKQLTLALVFAALLPAVASAQGLNVRVGLGWTGNFATNSFDYAGDDGNEFFNVGWGRGLNVGASIGYQFNDYFSADLGLGYLLGLNRTIETTNETAGVTTTTEDVYSSGFFQIVPSVTVGAFANDLAPYARFGLLLGLGSGGIESTTTNSVNSDEAVNTTTYTGGMAMGFQGAFGIRYNVSESFGIYAELVSNNWSYNPSSMEVESSVTASGITVEASETYDLVDDLDGITAEERPDIRAGLNSLGFNVGVSLSF
jgi:hypothetical protein